jgi:hypothetical protein
MLQTEKKKEQPSFSRIFSIYSIVNLPEDNYIEREKVSLAVSWKIGRAAPFFACCRALNDGYAQHTGAQRDQTH